MPILKNKKQNNHPRVHGLRRQERCRHCHYWTPIGQAKTKSEVLCPICM